jgi:hypothetical protein
MTQAAPIRVEYPAADQESQPVIVERVTPADVDEAFTRGVLRVVRDAYSAQFGDRQVPLSVIHDQYNPDDITPDELSERQQTIIRRIDSGKTQYWVNRTESGDLKGLSKIMTIAGMVYIGDVIVVPPWRGGTGSALLHAPLTAGGFPERKKVALDAFEGSSVNQWYYNLGFRPEEIWDVLSVGDYQLMTRRCSLPAAIGVSGLAARLEQRNPRLAESRVLAA